MPPALADTRVRTRSAFLAPLNEAQARLSELRVQQREGLEDLLALDNGIEATERELQPFLKRYELDGPDGMGPVSLACAFEIVDGALAQSSSAASAEHDISRANAVLLLGAAFDGHPATAALADAGVLPVVAIPSEGPCAGISLTDGLTRGAAVIADARAQGAESFLLGGDYVVFGARPRETVARVHELDAVAIRGNTDRWLEDSSDAPDGALVKRSLAWCRDELGPGLTHELATMAAVGASSSHR